MKKEHLISLGPFFFLFLSLFHMHSAANLFSNQVHGSHFVCAWYITFVRLHIVNLMLNMLPPKYTETLLSTSVLTHLVIDWDVKDTNFISEAKSHCRMHIT